MKRKLRDAMEAAYHNRNVAMPDIAAAMELARKVYGIDRVYLVTNREYKYQMNHVLTCSDDGLEYLRDWHVTLTKEQFETIVQGYREEPVKENSVDEVSEGIGGFFITAAILRNEACFGAVMFWCREPRVWTEEEKALLLEFADLVLLFLGLNNLVNGMNRYEFSRMSMEHRNVLSGMFLNLENGQCHMMKLVAFLQPFFPEWVKYSDFLDYYVRHYLDPVYGERLLQIGGTEALKKALTPERRIVTLEYPREAEGKVQWLRFRAECNTFSKNGHPRFVTVTFRDITEKVRQEAYMSGVTGATHNRYAVIASVTLENRQYAIYVDNRDAEARSMGTTSYGDYRTLHEPMLQSGMPAEYAESLRERFSVEAMEAHFDVSEESLQSVFPITVGEKTYWIRMEAVKTQEYATNGRRVLLYYRNITEFKNREMHFVKTQKKLEYESQRRKELAEHDSLTGVYNRRGYEEILKEFREDERPCAYLQIDIDHFKTLNDTYGHEVGDEALRQVAKNLKESFREDDYVFRFGGDEFAMLLVNCNEEAWESICEKQRQCHERINHALQKEVYVTLSIGISWSKSGFSEEMVTVADAALYQVKENGRAGCCVFDADRNPVFAWRDHMASGVSLPPSNPLEQCSTGACRMEVPGGDWEKGRLICNETARVLMGFTKEMTPEECFRTWVRRVDPAYWPMLDETKEALVDKGRAECSYRYHHPVHGEITVRSGGRCEITEEGIVLNGYHQSLQDIEVVREVDDSGMLLGAFATMSIASYYLDLKENSFSIFKSLKQSRRLEKQEVSATTVLEDFIDSLVQEEDRKAMREFLDLSTMAERFRESDLLEKEYRSTNPRQGWCRVLLIGVQRNADGEVTHVQFMASSIDREKKQKLEHEQKMENALRLQLRISEIVAKTKVQQVAIIEANTGRTRVFMNGIVSRDYIDVDFAMMREWGIAHTDPTDAPLFKAKFDLEYIRKELLAHSTCTMAYRQLETEDSQALTLVHHFEFLKRDPSKILLVTEDVTDATPNGIGRILEFDILDRLTESIALFDYETHEVIYMNRVAREYLGMEMKDLLGRCCYDLYGEHGKPCAFCSSVIRPEEEHGLVLLTESRSGKHIYLHGSVLEINGRKYLLEQALQEDQLGYLGAEWNELLSGLEFRVDRNGESEVHTIRDGAYSYRTVK